MASYRESTLFAHRNHPRRALRGWSRTPTAVLSRLEHAAQAGLARVVGDTLIGRRGFAGFAVSTAAAELRHLWPDTGVPRGFHLQSLRVRMRDAVEELSRELGRSPRPSEVAALLDEDLDDVIEAIADDEAYCGGDR